jgi:glucose-6-phosphate 1-dehydrogenase
VECWKLAGHSLERKLQGELGEWKLDKEVWRCRTIQLFSVFHYYLKEQIQELLANKREQQIQELLANKRN